MPLIDAPEAVWRPPVDNQAPPRVRWREEGNDAPPAIRHDLHCDFVAVQDPLGTGFYDGTYRVGSYDSNYFCLERLTPAPGPPFGVPPETVPAAFYRSRHLDVPSGFIDDRDCIHLFWAERECPADVAGSPDPTEQVALYYRKGCVQRCS